MTDGESVGGVTEEIHWEGTCCQDPQRLADQCAHGAFGELPEDCKMLVLERLKEQYPPRQQDEPVPWAPNVDGEIQIELWARVGDADAMHRVGLVLVDAEHRTMSGVETLIREFADGLSDCVEKEGEGHGVR
jgi:hypothetical protein